MHCISLTPRWSTISAIFCRFVCVLRPNRSSFTQMLYFYILIHRWRIFPPSFVGFWSSAVYLFPILFAPIISQNCRHYNVLPISCPINATSLSSCVFRLQNLIELHSRIVSIKNWKMYSFLKDINYPQNIEDQSCRCMLQNNLKVTRNLREKSSWATWQGGVNIFTNTLVCNHSNPSKYFIFNVFSWFMIKSNKYLCVLVFSGLF